MEKINIALIGGGGYIGSYIFDNLYNKYNDIFNVDIYDINEYEFFKKINISNINIKKGSSISKEIIQNYNIIIFFGGLNGRFQCNNKDEEYVYNENVEELLKICNMMNKEQLLIYASTSALYESDDETYKDELYECDINRMDLYVKSMYYREQKIKKLDINSIGLRLGTLIGLSLNQRSDLLHLLMLKNAIKDNIINIYEPKCNRPILYNFDLFNVILSIIKKYNIFKGHEIFNVCSYNIKIIDIANNIKKKTNIEYNIIKDSGLISGYKMDCSKLQKLLNIDFIGNEELIINELLDNINYIYQNYMYDNDCRVCKSKNTEIILDLGFHPLANNYTTNKLKQIKYPLCLIKCNDCIHTQLNYTINPNVMFKYYLYESGTSKTLNEYFNYLAKKVIRDTGLQTGSILEIACNDGSQLDYFKKYGWKTFGVDPALNIANKCIEKGHNMNLGFWEDDIEYNIPIPNVIMAQNVFAHVPNPIKFLNKCKKYMNEDTTLYIQTSQCNMFINGEFDTIYHEHLSYFTISSMMKACDICDLRLIDLSIENIHGQSYLFVIKLKNINNNIHSQKVYELYNKELSNGVYSSNFFIEYGNKVNIIKNNIIEIFEFFLKKNISVICYGAAAKGMTLLNYFNLNPIDYIIDDSILKHNKYTPNTNIIIRNINYLINDDRENLLIIVLAWNFFDEIYKRIIINRKNKTTYILKPLPIVELYRIENETINKLSINDIK